MAQIETLTVNGKTYTVNDPDSVSYGESQNLTEEQKKQGRQNIGAAADEEVVKTVNGHAPDEDGAVRTINDTKAGNDAWSSKNTVDKLCPNFAESGPLVVCEPVQGYPLEVVSQIAPALSGYASATLRCCGKNLIPYPYGGGWFTENGITLSIGTDGVFHINGTATGNIIRNLNDFVLQPGTYTYSVNKLFGRNVCPVQLFEVVNGNIGSTVCNQVGDISLSSTFTLTEPKTVRSRILIYSGAVVDDDICVQLELGNVATPYEPYRGETITADFGQTVYGGSYNWNTGALVSSWVRRVLTGSEDWYGETKNDGTVRFLLTFTKAKESSKVECSHFPTSNVETPNSVYAYASIEHIYFFVPDTATTVDAWKAYLAEQYANGTPVVLVYESNRAPTTIQLTPTEVLGLDDVNFLYSNTGETTVSGKADPKAMFKKLTNAIIALGGNV